jgi:alpha-ketoglutarate-dependent taurine dioxygenase
VLGARIEGVDLSRPLPDADFRVIEAALHRHCFIMFPGQALTRDAVPCVWRSVGGARNRT